MSPNRTFETNHGIVRYVLLSWLQLPARQSHTCERWKNTDARSPTLGQHYCGQTDRHILSKMITTPLRNEIYLIPVMANLIKIRRVVHGRKHLHRQFHQLKLTLCANNPCTKMSRSSPSIAIYVATRYDQEQKM